MKTKSIFIEKYGKPHEAFKLKEVEIPEIESDELLLEVESFGINYADIMARNGMYEAAPKPPFVPGYEISGRVIQVGKLVSGFKQGDKVLSFTRFGGYSSRVAVKAQASIHLAPNISMQQALALGTQYATAYYAAFVATHVFENEKVLIQAGAGGVGVALIQLLKLKNCKIAATAGSNEKIEFLKTLGVDLAIKYREENFAEVIKKNSDFGSLDVVFESVDGNSFKQGKSVLNAGGRIVIYGAANRKKGMLAGLNLLFSYGINHPLAYLMKSRSLVGVNMLEIADNKPAILRKCLVEVHKLAAEERLNPIVGKEFSYQEIAAAHAFVEERKSMGKVIVNWKD